MSKKRKKESGEPTWVKHPVHGWLPDECPVFDCEGWDEGKRELRVCAGPARMSPLAKGFPIWTYDLYEPVENGEFSCMWDGAGEDCYYRPLTTAARELLAALKAERGE